MPKAYMHDRRNYTFLKDLIAVCRQEPVDFPHPGFSIRPPKMEAGIGRGR